MALDMTAEQKETGKANFHRVVGHHGLTRRDFMKGMLAAGAVLPVSAAAFFGYKKLHGNPVKVGLIGAGDEGGVLVGEHNPDYLEFVAYSDIRPSNQKRIFDGEPPPSPRKGFDRIYGKDSAQKIKRYDNYKELLADKDVEAVVIALPLHLHAQASLDAMEAGKHVLCEKLMAWNVDQCKKMIQAADKQNRCLSIGHQRHYSMLYAHAVEVLNSGDLGDIKHIRALWHRNNGRPRLDDKGNVVKDAKGNIVYRDGWKPEIRAMDREALESKIRELGYKSMEELVRWRLYNRTGGGLMAELGSHQLDACSIFLGKVRPLAVSGVGGKHFYRDDREVDDHVYVTFEFPGKNYYADAEQKQVKDKDDVVVVTYSSINTNSFEPYGECVMGTKGTMVVESEQSVMLYGDAGRSMSMTVGTTGPGKPAVDSTSSPTGGSAAANSQTVGASAVASPPSRGYREEMEHFAYCVRLWDQGVSSKREEWPRCHGRVAMADAIVALTSNLAMKRRQRIEFKPEWFDAASSEVPDPEMKETGAS